MNSRIAWGVITFLFIVIIVLLYFLIVTPAHAPTIESGATTTEQTPATSAGTESAPLHERVVVTEPASGAIVGQTFNVTGEAPGNWYFEATFPIQVRDPDGNVLGRIGANAQGNWETTDQVAFKATMYLDGTYKGPATLILLRDNPSGLPQNDDSLEVPIVIK